jgi:hypothetical protein
LKSLLIFGACSILLSLSSCVHEYRCQCTIEYSGMSGLPEPQMKEYPIKDTRKKAKDLCESRSAEYEKDGVKAKEKCMLY